MSMTGDTRALRHPEKRNRPDNPIKRKPSWIRVKAPVSKEYFETRNIIVDQLVTLGVDTVDELAEMGL